LFKGRTGLGELGAQAVGGGRLPVTAGQVRPTQPASPLRVELDALEADWFLGTDDFDTLGAHPILQKRTAVVAKTTRMFKFIFPIDPPSGEWALILILLILKYRIYLINL
jgi:hypothetical protein